MRNWGVLTCALLITSSSAADDLTPPKDTPGQGVSRSARAKAKHHFALAQKLYKKKQYDAALTELHQADDLDPQPDYLFAIAQVHAKANHCADAITYYERYLATHPGIAATRAAEAARDVCKAKLPPPPPPPAPPPPDPLPAPEPARKYLAPSPEVAHWYDDKLTDGLLAGGAVAAVISGLTYRAALGDLEHADQSQTLADHEMHVQNARSMRTYSIVFGGAAAALVTVGVVRLVGRERAHAIAVLPVEGGGVLAISGTLR